VKYSDPSDFARALDRAVGIDTKFADAHRETTVFSDNGLSIALEMPYQGYRFGMLEALRKRDPVDAVSVPTFGAIVVSPSTIDAPDIVKLVLERDGKVVPPIVNLLEPSTMTTRLGVKAVLHAGLVTYPCSAFDPDATVRVIAIPAYGENIEVRLPFDELLMFSAKRSSTLSALLGKEAVDVETRLGKPSSVDGRWWTYEVDGGVVHIYFDADSRVVESVDPPAYDTRGFKKRETASPPPTATTAQSASPSGPSSTPSVVPALTVPTPSPLLGLSKDEVNAKLGSPSLRDRDVWNYDGPSGTLRITFTDGHVSSVRPDDFNLESLTVARKASPPAPTSPAPPAPAPPEAVAKCGDGHFVYVATGAKTCAGHGGIAMWFKKP
jgi:hypothetical protein